MVQKKYYIISYHLEYTTIDGDLKPSGRFDISYKKKGYGWYGVSDKDLAFKYNKKTAERIVAKLNAEAMRFYGNLERSRYDIEAVEPEDK